MVRLEKVGYRPLGLTIPSIAAGRECVDLDYPLERLHGPATLEGRIVDERTRQPIANAMIPGQSAAACSWLVVGTKEKRTAWMAQAHHARRSAGHSTALRHCLPWW